MNQPCSAKTIDDLTTTTGEGARSTGRIGVLGCGYLGAVHAACLAHWGHDVIGFDPAPEKVALLSAGKAPFHEEGLEALLTEGVRAGNLAFTTETGLLSTCTAVFICVGTPQLPDSHAADLSQVHAAVVTVLSRCEPGTLVIGKSTVPVGTAEALEVGIQEHGMRLIWNPEFLREGTAVKDTLEPDRIVLGAERPEDATGVAELYRPALDNGAELVVTNLPTAEIIKEAANSFLATKISFINAVGDLCERTGGDVEDVARALGLDTRIGAKFLKAGIGYGGGCFPKDVRALAHRAEELGAEGLAHLLHATDAVNTDARERSLRLVHSYLDPIEHPGRVALLGITFKPGSDDLRDSPALWLLKNLETTRPGVRIAVHDPAFAGSAIVGGHPMRGSIEEAVEGADLIVVATDWQQFAHLEAEVLAGAAGRVLIDLRNCVTSEPLLAAGWTIHPLGRPVIRPSR